MRRFYRCAAVLVAVALGGLVAGAAPAQADICVWADSDPRPIVCIPF